MDDSFLFLKFFLVSYVSLATLMDSAQLPDTDIDKILVSVCNWPSRSRRGDILDTSELFLMLFEIL